MSAAGWSECTGAPEQQWTFQDGLLANAGRDECLHVQRYCTLFASYPSMPLSQPSCACCSGLWLAWRTCPAKPDKLH